MAGCKHNPQEGGLNPEGECSSTGHFPTRGVIIELFPIAKCSFRKP